MKADNCQKCGCYPQQVLQLDCGHCYCLQCSSRLAYSHHFTCTVCAKRTQLLPQTVSALSKYKGDSPANQVPCSQHMEQQAAYFCFDCICSCVCAQCVVHGQHKGHQVHKLGEARPIIETRLCNIAESLQEKLISWESMRSSSESELLVLEESKKTYLAKLQELKEKQIAKVQLLYNHLRHQLDGLFARAQSAAVKDIELLGSEMADIHQWANLAIKLSRRPDAELLNGYVEHQQALQSQLARQKRTAKRELEWEVGGRQLLSKMTVKTE